jgi:ABC-type transport system involved in cytochrome bd biosynthesis fused ATPase/permease subunit
LMRTLLERGRTKTIIVVTHQSAIARKLDEVVVLRQGRIAARDAQPASSRL